MLKLNPDSRIRRRPSYVSKREEIISKWKDYIVSMDQSVENMNGVYNRSHVSENEHVYMLTDITLLLQPVIDKLGSHDMETIYEEFGPFEIRYDYGVAKIEIHLKENII